MNKMITWIDNANKLHTTQVNTEVFTQCCDPGKLLFHFVLFVGCDNDTG